MSDELMPVRDEAKDDFFIHLRKQDAEIAAIRSDIEFLVAISKNLEGFSKFCARWGRRFNQLLRWLALVGPGLALIWTWLSHPIGNWLKSKGAP